MNDLDDVMYECTVGVVTSNLVETEFTLAAAIVPRQPNSDEVRVQTS